MPTKFKKVATKFPRAFFICSLNYFFISRGNPYLFNAKINSKIYNVCGKKTLTGKRIIPSRDEKNEKRFARFPLQSARCSRYSAISQRRRDYTHHFV